MLSEVVAYFEVLVLSDSTEVIVEAEVDRCCALTYIMCLTFLASDDINYVPSFAIELLQSYIFIVFIWYCGLLNYTFANTSLKV